MPPFALAAVVETPNLGVSTNESITPININDSENFDGRPVVPINTNDTNVSTINPNIINISPLLICRPAGAIGVPSGAG
ncbi:hypothetical protein HCG49_01350 [Arenibacter sp. 6A1]|uniref:hypothetical protein n=1 Tax=Arenibacter sp. 6A1 TaxID=2720391 RepID=UPI001445397F|nr:hypothetical protein [Arenibacter sp. 6A1]NKI25205.1 hypothetical protein [Arenibacter sp. 6A1]